MRYLAVDFGSTYTKLTAIDGEKAAIIGTSTAFTTISTDVRDGFATACARLEQNMGAPFAYDELLVCSSAAGGLTMVALGLVPELTSRAAKMAAESAGAKVMKAFAYEISRREVEEIKAIRPDIVLLSGGTDGGNKEVILHNARLLIDIDVPFSIIAAGNKSVEDELEALLKASDKRYIITENVMPVFGTLNIEPARACIRDIFIERIIDAKGLSAIQAMTEHPIVPTPYAVLKGCELLSRGTGTTQGLGDFMAVDLGGATTDVYSLGEGAPSLDNVLIKGLPEPYAKRTVEGDLGMRYSLPFLMEEAGVATVAAMADVAPEVVQAWGARCAADPEICPESGTPEQRVDEALASCAVACALLRHCGVMEQVFTPMGELFTLTGKDMSHCTRFIGIGGALKNSSQPTLVLGRAVEHTHKLDPRRMTPREPLLCLDEKYIFSAMGLLGMVDAELALSIMKQEIHPLRQGR